MMRIFLIIFLFFNVLIFNPVYSFAKIYNIKWTDSGFNHSGPYIQIYKKGFKKVNINGKLNKYNITYLLAFPGKKNQNEKNWECRAWTVEESYNDNKYLNKAYSLNDCLPCLDKESGYLCSYPYFKMTFRSRLNDQILLEKEDDKYSEFMDDGTNYVNLSINLSSRERIEIIERSIKIKGITKPFKTLFGSRIVKYNTKYRQIPSESSEIKSLDDDSNLLFFYVFERLKENVNLAIENKNNLKIREKDIKSLLSIEPSATIYKFQTRD